jgi:exopolysaccharide biosynthesis polyprenyl glycosylphosphotransferase
VASARPPVFARDIRRDALRRRLLATADLVTCLAVAFVVSLTSVDGAAAALWAAGLAPAWLVIAKFEGLYDADHARLSHITIDELPGLFHWATLSVAMTVLGLAVLPTTTVSPEGAAAMWVVAFAGAILLRSLSRALWRRAVPADRGVLIGDGPVALALERKLALERAHHLELIHRIAPVQNGRALKEQELADLLRSERIDRVLVAVEDLDEQVLATVLAACRTAGVKMSVAPPLRAVLGTAVSLNHLAELPLIEFRTWDVSASTLFLKRVVDIIGGTVLLVIASPLLVVIAVAIKLDSRGPILFRQERAGLFGHPFQIIKFRTMVADAEARLCDLVDLEALEDPMFKLTEDPRITRVGRILRRVSLDELPQLFNVLRGDMSLVGPRPEEARLVARYGEPARRRLEMRPGLTGPMQVHGRGDLTFQERLAIDREYVDNYSLRKDIEILLRTVSVVIRGGGAY